MTATVQLESKSPSRRALLAGVLGGLGAWATSAVGRGAPVRANDPYDVVLGATNNAVQQTKISCTQDAFWGESTGSSTGVRASSSGGYAVYADSLSYISVLGLSSASNQPAIHGWSFGNATGVLGSSGASQTARPKTGVYGYANQDSLAKGVWGDSPSGHAVQGTSSSGWAGYFAGRVFTERYTEMKEINTPAGPGANRLRLFARDNGSGKTQLCVRFATGAVKVLATQP